MTSDIGPPVSGRVGLARLAAQAIALTDGVTATTGPAGRWLTIGSGQTIPGVLAVEDGQGRVEIELHLVARWPPQMPLERLGEKVRARLRRSAAIAGVGARLGAVSIAFDDVMAEATIT
ncbi:MAG: hypothetical protein QOJ63_2885 [Solirubrobacteraceae bacterium]|nr:hypothetical protein [Solirubrobacteraceae bacterium]